MRRTKSRVFIAAVKLIKVVTVKSQRESRHTCILAMECDG